MIFGGRVRGGTRVLNNHSCQIVTVPYIGIVIKRYPELFLSIHKLDEVLFVPQCIPSTQPTNINCKKDETIYNTD